MLTSCKLGVLVLLAAPLSAAPHRYRLYPNSSIHIQAIAPGPDGFLWLGTESGLFRFDGAHYQRIAGYPFTSVRFVGVVANGQMWLAGKEGLVRYDGRFQVINTEQVTGLAVSADGVLITTQGGIRRFNFAGRQTASSDELHLRFITVDSAGHPWVIFSDSSLAAWLDAGLKKHDAFAVPADVEQAVVDGNGDGWVALKDEAWITGSTHLSRIPRTVGSRAPPLQPGKKGQLWFVGDAIYGLHPEISFVERHEFDVYAATAAYEDPRGHLWVARQNLGLIEWIPDEQWDRWFSEDFGGDAVSNVFRTDAGDLVAAARTNLYRLNIQNGRWTPIGKDAREYHFASPLPDGGFLASIEKLGFARLSANGAILEQPPNVLATIDDHREHLRDSRDRLWVANKTVLLRLRDRRAPTDSCRSLCRTRLPLSRRWTWNSMPTEGSGWVTAADWLG